MKKIVATVLVLVFVVGMGTAHAAMTTIDFESPPDIGDYTTGNFTIGDAAFTNWYVFGDSSGSGNHIAAQLSFLGTKATILFTNPVNDLNFDLLANNTELYVNGDYTTNLLAGHSNYEGTLFDLLGYNLNNVSSLSFEASAGSTGIDDITYTPTPIPGALWLLGSGLVGMVGLRRKFRS